MRIVGHEGLQVHVVPFKAAGEAVIEASGKEKSAGRSIAADSLNNWK
jgi:hypothetical protein